MRNFCNINVILGSVFIGKRRISFFSKNNPLFFIKILHKKKKVLKKQLKFYGKIKIIKVL